MQQFVAVAVAHFLALLIPGVDFFLIARTATTGGWRNATGVCLGIAAANGVFIAAAFSGLSLIAQPVLLASIQVAGGGFLIFIGTAFLRSRAQIDLDRAQGTQPATWWRNLGIGLTSGLLNPKNALFYLSLAATLTSAAPVARLLYGIWMFLVVLAWDVFVAVVLSSRRALARLGRLLPVLTRLAGGILVLFGGGMIIRVALRALN